MLTNDFDEMLTACGLTREDGEPVRFSHPSDPKQITIRFKRTWKDRLFSRPWRPLRAYREMVFPQAIIGLSFVDGQPYWNIEAVTNNQQKEKPC